VLVPEAAGVTVYLLMAQFCSGARRAFSSGPGDAALFRPRRNAESQVDRRRRGLSVLALFPLAGSGFYIELVAEGDDSRDFALSLDLLVGYTGLVSFGHAAFYGIGAYTLG
jgi:hypothetical protein